ncbi:MAG: DUF1232 domain-containing protein [Aequorivita sp.]|uniref:DUF1232 domain-containing protein n=2 Tax=Aequorivita vladivostokensis TaxID=171194 RepID=A0ABR5DGV1_9FLAO|nr:hypothetical protein MB09_11765 [Aequorivita vladivostokensis]MAO48863.1 DUF1232 domain-containing protein [Aequorivita sp.]HAV54550.1 DUF1232 domain-containing protein [Aequorivita sp.]
MYFNPGNRDTGTKEYMEEEVTKIEDDDVEVVLENEEAINKKFSGANSLSKYAELGKIMVGMLKDVKNSVYPHVPWFTIATIVLALLYVLNPFDIIPDFIPGIGFIDDVSVLAIGVGWIETDLHKYLDWKIKEGKGL